VLIRVSVTPKEPLTPREQEALVAKGVIKAPPPVVEVPPPVAKAVEPKKQVGLHAHALRILMSEKVWSNELYLFRMCPPSKMIRSPLPNPQLQRHWRYSSIPINLR
jgi:hypothetical protein